MSQIDALAAASSLNRCSWARQVLINAVQAGSQFRMIASSIIAEDSHSLGKPLTPPSVIDPAVGGAGTAPGTKYPKGKKQA